MKNTTTEAVPSRVPQRELAVIVRCHDVACAIPTRWVERLVLPEDVAVFGPNVAVANGKRYASWDLGELLGLAPLHGAWVLVRLPGDAGEIPLALRTGPCLGVQTLPRRVDLSPRLFISRPGAVAGVFASTAAFQGALCGLEIDLSRLWTPTELATSAAHLRQPTE